MIWQNKKFSQKGLGGITLIELIVVLGIIGVLSVFAIPSYRQYLNSQKIIGEATDFASLLRRAQQLTVTEQKITKVEILNSQQYRILKEDLVLEEKILANDVYLQAPCSQISFNFAGAPSCWGEFLFQNNNQTRKVIMNAAGFIYIQ